MSDTELHPYSIEVVPPKPGNGNYHWAIRRAGKLMQRSDRGYPSETKAESAARAQVERLLHGVEDR